MFNLESKIFMWLSLAIFIGYMPVGLPLSVLPVYVSHDLGLNDVLVGIVIGVQYVVTIATRGYSGRIADTYGSRQATMGGMLICAFAGTFFLVIVWVPLGVAANFILLVLNRGILGFGQGLMITGNLTWGFAYMGAHNSGRVMGWNGMAVYGSLAVGVPVGVLLTELWGMQVVALVSVILPLLSFLMDIPIKPVPLQSGKRISIYRVVGLIWQYGLALALQGVGFAVISTFSALYFIAHGWVNTGLALTCFGLAYAGVRVFISHLPDRMGGHKVAAVSMACETLGLAIIWLAASPLVALIGFVVTGIGCSLIFPALGVEVLKKTPINMQGTAIGGFSAFQDLSYGGAGPLVGFLVPLWGYPSVFCVASMCALLAFVMVLYLARMETLKYKK